MAEQWLALLLPMALLSNYCQFLIARKVSDAMVVLLCTNTNAMNVWIASMCCLSCLPGVNVAPPGNDERVGGNALTVALELPPLGCLQIRMKIRHCYVYSMKTHLVIQWKCTWDIYKWFKWLLMRSIWSNLCALPHQWGCISIGFRVGCNLKVGWRWRCWRHAQWTLRWER